MQPFFSEFSGFLTFLLLSFWGMAHRPLWMISHVFGTVVIRGRWSISVARQAVGKPDSLDLGGVAPPAVAPEPASASCDSWTRMELDLGAEVLDLGAKVLDKIRRWKQIAVMTILQRWRLTST